jgi:methylamine dehydrogenase heavy chain
MRVTTRDRGSIREIGRKAVRLLPALTLCAALSGAAQAEVDADPLVGSDLPAASNPHWVWVNDFVFHHMADGKAFLIDGDAGSMRGMLSTGFGFGGVLLPKSRSQILAPETYFSRGTRGTRTDVVTFYDPRKLSPTGEVEIPAKRVSAMPMLSHSGLTDDDRFLLIYNYTPQQSISVVDVQSKSFVGEIDGAGCALVYPTGPRSYFSLCGNGGAFSVQLDDAGKAINKAHTEKPLFDPEADPVTEKGVRVGNTWWFATFGGDVLPLETTPTSVRAGQRWSLLDAEAKAEGWLPGGMQHLAVHTATKRLYSLMHIGGAASHKDPGTEIWVYDLATQKRVQRIKLEDPATSTAITQDAQPLLFTIFIGAQKVDVYDPQSGKRLRVVSEIGFTPTTLVTY